MKSILLLMMLTEVWGKGENCFYNGIYYKSGANITRDKNNCHGTLCQDGQLLAWDHKCSFGTPACPGGTNIPVKGQCCPICVTTTPSAPPRNPGTSSVKPSIGVNGCKVDGKLYHFGAEIHLSATCETCSCTLENGLMCNNMTACDRAGSSTNTAYQLISCTVFMLTVTVWNIISLTMWLE